MSDKIHKHFLTPGLVSILEETIRAVKAKGANKVHRDELAIDYKAQANLQKLRYFGLLAKYEENGKHKLGWWAITLLGGRFLRREFAANLWVRTLHNHIVEKSEEKRFITDFIGKKPYFQSDFPYERIEMEARIKQPILA